MFINQVLDPNTATAGTPVDAQPSAARLDPETVIEQIRSIRAQVDEVRMTTTQKRTVSGQIRKQTDTILAGSINVIGALDNVAQAIGQPVESVRQMQTDWNRWTAVADEVRGLLNGIEGANLARRHELSLIAAQAVSIGTQLARNPANSVLVPHLQELKRLKALSNRKKTAENPQTPTPNPAPAPKAEGVE